MAEDASEGNGPIGGEIVPAPRNVLRFALATLAWSVVFFPLWYAASKPISSATGWVAARAIVAVGPVDAAAATLRDERVVFTVQPDLSRRYLDRLPAGMLFETGVDPRKQTVGLAFFLALVAAARPRHWWRAAAGFAALVVLAGIGVACEAAVGFASVAAPSGPPLFRPGAVAGTALALGYQLGTLLVPTLAPIAFWLWARAGPAGTRRKAPIDV